ncbi:phage portal protein [Rhizobium rhizoryzae]|uniref:HK97 family phage portal protein n=1 Tax=Rhizobium rhizoryzae TaxID=451876 RepID=A0A7W6LMB1_9HYPH|nr:phage portal protein [Rhizobium rhizoryzae]MBB4146033.1 HK97 family phage portal protein [Rhizobium rhizoryzae]
MKLTTRLKSAVVRWFNADAAASGRVSGLAGDAGEIVSENSAMSLSAVWACVNLLAGTIASLPVMIYRPDGKGRQQVAADHPLYRVLHLSPNYDQTALDFWEFAQASLELWGNAYARIERVGGQVIGLYPVAPGSMVVRRLQGGDLEYRWSEEGRTYTATDKNMLHIRGFGGNPLGGMGTLQFGRNTFSLARAGDRVAGKMFANGMQPSGVLKFDKFLTEPQRAIAEDKIASQFVGARNAGKPLILEGGASWSQISLNPEDAQMLETRSYSVEEICRFFGVPPFMIGHNEKSSGYPTSLEQQVLTFQKFALRRRLKRIEQALTKQLLTSDDRAKGLSIEFNLEGLLRGDSQGRARFYQAMTAIGAMTINEVRALENLPDVEGGDVPRMQMQNKPITEIDREAIRELISEEQGQKP